MLTLDLSKQYSIGHRCAEIGAVENSLEALELAIELGLDFAEIDVQVTKDKQWVLFHDTTMHKKTGVFGHISDFSYSQLQNFRVKTAAGSAPIATLEEILNRAQKSNIKLLIELKAHGYYQIIVQLLEKYRMTDRVIIDSFYYPWLRDFQKLTPNISHLWLIERKMGFQKFGWRKTIQMAVDANFVGISVHFKNLQPQLIAECHKKHLAVIVWGVPGPYAYPALLALPINGFTAGDPKALINQMRRVDHLP
jgi:glycerophosphoryl diester phosphodiesterase